MRRREFITLFGGAALTWPLATRAQQPTMPVIGFLAEGTPSSEPDALPAFRQGLREAAGLANSAICCWRSRLISSAAR